MLSKTWLPALALTTGLVLGASTTALTQTAPPPARHPHIASAERALHHAARQLEEASYHYGGHRAKALELTRLAEVELREAVAWANTHPEEFVRR